MVQNVFINLNILRILESRQLRKHSLWAVWDQRSFQQASLHPTAQLCLFGQDWHYRCLLQRCSCLLAWKIRKQSLCSTVCQLGEVHRQKYAPGEHHTETKHNRASVCLCAAWWHHCDVKQRWEVASKEAPWSLHRPFKWDLQHTFIGKSDPRRWSSEIPWAPNTSSPNFLGVSCCTTAYVCSGHYFWEAACLCNDLMAGTQLQTQWWGQYCPHFTYCCKDSCIRKGQPELQALLSLQPSVNPQ